MRALDLVVVVVVLLLLLFLLLLMLLLLSAVERLLLAMRCSRLYSSEAPRPGLSEIDLRPSRVPLVCPLSVER